MGNTNPAKPRDPAVDAAIALLANTWPAVFSVFERRRRPLAIGINRDVQAALGSAITPEELSQALRCYTANAWYLRALVTGAARIGLDGNPAGVVTEQQAARAAGQLERRLKVAVDQKRVSAKQPQQEVVTVVPRRLGLADLKRLALSRKQVA